MLACVFFGRPQVIIQNNPMTIKNTKSKGFTITSNGTEAILKGNAVEIHRANRQDDDEAPFIVQSAGEFEVSRIGIDADKIHDADGYCFLIYADELTIGYFPFPP